MKIFAIGDIHGRLDLLEKMLDKVQQNTRIIFLGDYIDRGTDSVGVLRLVKTLVDSGRALALKGNHEDMMLRALVGDQVCEVAWLAMERNGGRATAASILGVEANDLSSTWFADEGVMKQIRDFVSIEMRSLFASMKIWHQEKGIIFVHAGFHPDVPFRKQSEFDMLWIRDEFLSAEAADFRSVWPAGAPFVVPGHSPNDPRQAAAIQGKVSWRVNLDGGSYRHNGGLKGALFSGQKLVEIINVY